METRGGENHGYPTVALAALAALAPVPLLIGETGRRDTKLPRSYYFYTLKLLPFFVFNIYS
jgi:hypothetical protein